MSPLQSTDEIGLSHGDLLTATIQRPRHISGLDGLRAVSITLVVLMHTLQQYNETHHVPHLLYTFTNGGMGVLIFFVISGYLITTLLLREYERTGTMSMTSFYIRRAFRILPPLYFYILFIAVLGLTHHLPDVYLGDVIQSLTFTRNYLDGPLWAFGHLWSLCVEEQFYLLWPAVLVFFFLHRKVANKRRAAACVALVVIVVEPLIRVGSYHFLPQFHRQSMFHMIADCLMFGALGALLEGDPLFEAVVRRVTRWPWLVPILLFFGSGLLGVIFMNYWNLPFGETIDGFLALMWLIWLTRNPESRMGLVMNLPAVAWLGRLSYSIYIWQTFFLHSNRALVFGDKSWLNIFPVSWLCILAVAVFSFYCIEQPSLRLRDVVMRRLHWRET